MIDDEWNKFQFHYILLFLKWQPNLNNLIFLGNTKYKTPTINNTIAQTNNIMCSTSYFLYSSISLHLGVSILATLEIQHPLTFSSLY